MKKIANMLRHIKKKTVHHFILDNVASADLNLHPDFPPEKLEVKPSDFQNHDLIIVTDKGEAIHTFLYREAGKNCAMPMANPILIYFNVAQSQLRSIYKLKEELLNQFTPDIQLSEKSLQLFYDFFGATSTFIVQLSTAVEASINQAFPVNLKYEVSESGKYTKSYDAEQIQRWLSTPSKIKVLDQHVKKSFAASYNLKQTHLDNLFKLRDEIVHTKVVDGYTSYREMYKRTLRFKFDETIDAVMHFINFYHPDLIEPCPCGQDF